MNTLNNKIVRFFLCLIFFSPQVGMAVNTYGYVEKIRINPGNTQVKAKLDTGAVSASLNATNIKIIKKNNQQWVSFDVPQTKGVIHLERKLLRFVRIKKRLAEVSKTSPISTTKRPVVQMQLTLGFETKCIDVNLANRQAFNYPLLLGRKSLIIFNVAVNPAKTFVSMLKE